MPTTVTVYIVSSHGDSHDCTYVILREETHLINGMNAQFGTLLCVQAARQHP